jgi:hypothetical protein
MRVHACKILWSLQLRSHMAVVNAVLKAQTIVTSSQEEAERVVRNEYSWPKAVGLKGQVPVIGWDVQAHSVRPADPSKQVRTHKVRIMMISGEQGAILWQHAVAPLQGRMNVSEMTRMFKWLQNVYWLAGTMSGNVHASCRDCVQPA